ncbi:MAG: sensor domain-containing diguanylate cyclase [Methylococcaceae bacterium]|nr:MAG: sensor domain-containing diguanylate cyclase [Methylococcaceae bacterium]
MPQPPALLNQICYAIDAGLLAIDRDENIVLWNRWLERRSEYQELHIAGLPFAQAFPAMAGSRVHQAIQAALSQGLSSLVSQSLNRQPFPLFVETNRFDRNPMQQAISVIPLNCEAQRYCLVRIHDVTAAVNREQELQRIAKVLEQHSFQDGLTGIANRRAFDQQFLMEFRRALREEQPLTVVLIDVDHFKAYNDLYGHLAGDECLKRIAQKLRKTLLRPADMVARYGGEEFAALLPHTDRPGAESICRALCQAVLAEGIPHQASATAPHVSISLGSVTLTPTRQLAPDFLLNLADQALYRAKQAGRNQVCVISEAEALQACLAA